MRLLCLCALVLLCGAAPDPGPRLDVQGGASYARDRETVAASRQAMTTGRAPALAAFIPALQEVQSHTPSGYREIEQAAGEIHYRAETREDFLAFAAWSRARTKRTVVWYDRTYINASFLLGWYYNETKQPDQALAALERGLTLAPGTGRLIAEQGQALIALRHIDLALALYDRALAADEFMPGKLRALLLRAKGFCLTESKQYDAAEQAYRDSLALEPDHVGARQELAYIARVRGGGAPTAGVMSTYDKMKQSGTQGLSK